MKPLDGARLKVVRAQVHLDSLKREIGAYLDAHPYDFPIESDGNVFATKEAVIKIEPPLELGCIVGDCLGNLRSSLDYIAWQLVLKHSPVAPVAGKDIVYFPLAKDAARFNANGRPNLARYSVPTAAIDLIESLQPYHAGYEPLELLSALGNEDKHRLPLLTLASANTAAINVSVIAGPPLSKITIQAPGGGFTASGFNTGGLGIRQLTDDDLLPDGRPKPTDMVAFMEKLRADHKAAQERASANLPRDVKVDGQVTVFVSLQNAPVPLEPVDRTLENIVKCVADIVPRFEPFV